MTLGTPAVISTINSDTDGTSYAGTSTAASANSLLVAFVGATRGSSTNPPAPTVANTPWGLTWSRVTAADKIWVGSGTPRRGGWIFVAKTSGAAGSDSFDLAFSATVASCVCIVVEITGADVSGTELDAVVQCATPVNGTAANFITSLSAASDPDNRAIAFYQIVQNTGQTIVHDSGGGWTEIDERATTAPAGSAAVHWLGTGFDTSPSATPSNAPTTTGYGAWSLEIKEGAAGGAPPPEWFEGVLPI